MPKGIDKFTRLTVQEALDLNLRMDEQIAKSLHKRLPSNASKSNASMMENPEKEQLKLEIVDPDWRVNSTRSKT